MLKWWVYFLIAVFIIDIIYRTFICKKINLNSIKIQNISGEIYDLDLPQNISKDNHVKYDKNLFDPNIMHFHSEKNNKKKIEYIEEEDEIIYPEKTKMVELDEDDIEFEGLIPKPQKRINVTIEYDEKYQNLYNELSRQLDGNISFLDFYPQIIYLQGVAFRRRRAGIYHRFPSGLCRSPGTRHIPYRPNRSAGRRLSRFSMPSVLHPSGIVRCSSCCSRLPPTGRNRPSPPMIRDWCLQLQVRTPYLRP